MRNQKKFTKTDVVKGNLNPAWPPMQLKLKHVDGNPDAPIRIECMDWDRAGSDELIGYVDTTPRALCQSGLQLPLVDPKSSKLPGSLRIDFFAIVHKPQRGYGHRGDGDDHDGGFDNSDGYDGYDGHDGGWDGGHDGGWDGGDDGGGDDGGGDDGGGGD
mmetsp:Transcript_19408/g.30376  ORF Transcript_19408/g.30376 Transcript_19408/m.30376 type:complete len:159 (+) Transcript_19408:653-1129(+)